MIGLLRRLCQLLEASFRRLERLGLLLPPQSSLRCRTIDPAEALSAGTVLVEREHVGRGVGQLLRSTRVLVACQTVTAHASIISQHEVRRGSPAYYFLMIGFLE